MLLIIFTVKILERIPYKKVMSVLNRAKKIKPENEDWKLIRINPSQEKILQELGLLDSPAPAPKRKRGGHKKSTI